MEKKSLTWERLWKKFKPLKWRMHALNISLMLKKDTEKTFIPIIKNFSPPESVLIVKYEDLLNKNKQMSVLNDIITFTDFESSTARMECAFLLADVPKVHRKIRLSKDFMYSTDDKLICEIWANVKEFADAFHYKILNETSCST
jgi:hypothetical protein